MSVPTAVVYLALMAFVSSSAEMDCSYLGLLNHLNLTETNYALSNVQPVLNWTTPTYVMVDLLIFGILEVNEKSQTFTCRTMSLKGWQNQFLHWNPEEFCRINRLAVPRSMLWHPHILIQEDVSDTAAHNSPYVHVYYDGWVLASESRRLTTTCEMNLWRFPFDIQTCDITFTSFFHSDSSITLGTFSSNSFLTMTSENLMATQGEWDLKSITTNKTKLGVYSENYTSDILTYKVTIERRPMLYIMNFMMPLFFLLVLDVASFFISDTSGEKLGFKVTILLSISVLMLILQDILPSPAYDLPLIVIYSITIFLMVGFSVLESMLINLLINLDEWVDKDAQRSPKACEDIQTQAGCHKESAGVAEKDEDKPETKSLDLELPSDPNLLKLILEAVTTARQEWFSVNCVERGKRKLRYYERVALYIDSVYFAIYMISIVSFLSWIYSHWLSGK